MNIEVVKIGDLKIVPNELVRNFIFYLEENGFGDVDEEFQKMDFFINWFKLLDCKVDFLNTFNHSDYSLVDFKELWTFIDVLESHLEYVKRGRYVSFSFEYWFAKVNKYGVLEYKFLEKC